MFSGGFGGFGGFGGMSQQEDSASAPKKEVDTNAYYELLGVEKSATTEQIRKAFRKKAMKQHPDKGGDANKFKLITNAYQTLTNPEKRQLYDDYGEEGVQNGGPPGGGGFGDIFEMFGRKRDTGPRKGRPKLHEVQVTLNDIYNGNLIKVPIKRTRNCEKCDGKGGQNVKKCDKCKGKGQVQKLVQVGPGMYTQSAAKCADCKGTGEIMKKQDRCKECDGEKVKVIEKVLEVGLEKGCPNQHDYIFTGQSDEYPGLIPGDIHIRIKIKDHKTFIRKGADLFIVKKITLLEALTGVTMNIEHLDKRNLTIATPPGEIITHGSFRKIKGEGLPFYNDIVSHGNLVIEFLVEFPKKNYFNKEKTAQIISILGMEVENEERVKKAKILQDFNEADLNPNPEGGQHEEEQQQHHGGGQRVQCQSQ